ncbi:MAG: glucose 1-dehydrogenase [Anaerolineales bacterium]|nr:glucose 1-dehydrogenase [Anaerolineales bacterium]
MRFMDRVAIVTGSSRGMGRTMALGLAREGASVVVISHRHPEKGQEVTSEVEKLGGQALHVQADVSDKADVQRMVQATLDKFGRIDILINNAGIHMGAPFTEESEEMWWELFRVNVMGVVLPTQAVVPHMIERGKGKIVITVSKAAVVGEPYHAAYSASKGAVLSLTRALAIELAPHNITVNAVCPGPVLTDMLLEAVPDPAEREELASSAPLGRVGKVEDIVGAVLYLASEESDWCTGQAISIDGGMSVLK